jgi:hypothetical protein
MRRLVLTSLMLCACGGGDGSGGPGGSGGGATGRINLVTNVIAGSQAPKAAANVITVNQGALDVGSPTAASLKSLKYYITAIQLCESLEIMGTAYNNPQGCIAIYQADMAGAPDYGSYLATQAKDDRTTGRFVDLMTAEGQATLRRPVSLEIPIAPPLPDGGAAPESDGGAMPMSKAGVYRYGLISFYRPIKVTAEFPIVGKPGQYYRTRAVSRIHPGGVDGMFSSERVEIGDTLSGPTEETTYMLNNGGVVFTFQKPFSITQADVDAKAEIKIDLVFNPDNFGQVFPVANCLTYGSICDLQNNVSIDMPYVRMNPVPRKTGERTRKETYLMDYDVTSKLRIELYYNDADPEAGVQGVDMAIVYTAAPQFSVINTVARDFVSQTGSVRSNDASVTFMDYTRTPNLELRRRQNGTATFHCLLQGMDCPAGSTVSRAYTFVGDTVVSSD